MALAALAGPLAGDWLVSHQGFPAVFAGAALAGGLCVLASLLIREPPGRNAADALSPFGLREALASRNVRAGAAAITPLGIAFGAMITFWPLVAIQHHLTTIGAFFTVYAVGLLTVQILAGRLADRIGRGPVMLAGMLWAGATFALIPVARSDMASLLVAFLCGVGMGVARTAMDAFVCEGIPAKMRGTAIAVEFTTNDLWIGLGSALLGPLAGWAGYNLAYAVVGITCVAMAGALAVFRPRPAAAQGP